MGINPKGGGRTSPPPPPLPFSFEVTGLKTRLKTGALLNLPNPVVSNVAVLSYPRFSPCLPIPFKHSFFSLSLFRLHTHKHTLKCLVINYVVYGKIYFVCNTTDSFHEQQKCINHFNQSLSFALHPLSVSPFCLASLCLSL